MTVAQSAGTEPAEEKERSMRRTAMAALATAMAGAGVLVFAGPAQAAVPSCVGHRSTGYYYAVYVDNACSTSQRVKVDWGTFAPDSSCRTIPAQRTYIIQADAIWRASSTFSGLKSC